METLPEDWGVLAGVCFGCGDVMGSAAPYSSSEVNGILGQV